MERIKHHNPPSYTHCNIHMQNMQYTMRSVVKWSAVYLTLHNSRTLTSDLRRCYH